MLVQDGEKLIDKLSEEEGHSVSRLPEFTAEEKEMIKGTCDFYSLQMYSTRLVTKKDPANDAKLMADLKERIRLAPDIELPGHELETLLYWFRPGWYGDMQVWTALDQVSYFSNGQALKTVLLQEWERAESIWLRNTPWGLRRMINWIDRRYPESGGIWITENGISLGNAYADVDRYQYIYLHFNEILKDLFIKKFNQQLLVD